MNKREIGKLEFFMQGLLSRFLDAEDFFTGMDFEFVSGKKTFKGLYDDRLYFNKEYYDLDFEGALAFIKKEAVKYDALTLNYKERGTSILIKADNKDVSIKQRCADQASGRIPCCAR